jgi:S-adenosylmethionine synthetase
VSAEALLVTPLLTVSVIGCCAQAMDALLAGLEGRAATIVTPVRASVTEAAAGEAVSPPLGRVGLAFSHPSASAQSAATPATLIFLLSMCTYRLRK